MVKINTAVIVLHLLSVHSYYDPLCRVVELNMNNTNVFANWNKLVISAVSACSYQRIWLHM